MDFDNETILIQHSRIHQETDGRETVAGQDILKRKSSYRTLPMTDQVRIVLLAEQERQNSVKSLLLEDFICVTPNSQPISPNYYSQCFKKFLRDHGLREVRLHDLRHTCASLLIQNRMPLIEVQQWLGHSTLEATADLYARLEYETKINSTEMLKKI